MSTVFSLSQLSGLMPALQLFPYRYHYGVFVGDDSGGYIWGIG